MLRYSSAKAARFTWRHYSGAEIGVEAVGDGGFDGEFTLGVDGDEGGEAGGGGVLQEHGGFGVAEGEDGGMAGRGHGGSCFHEEGRRDLELRGEPFGVIPGQAALALDDF